jgi:hypothetical protein
VTARGALGVVSLLLSLGGCSGQSSRDEPDTGVPYPYVESVPVAGCDVPDACDILAGECQQRWLATVICFRGMDSMAVPIRVIDQATYASELELTPAEPRPSPDHAEIALSWLGFVAPGSYAPVAVTQDRVQNVAAYYDPALGEITVIDRGVPATSILQNQTLFHEIVHAAQDQDYGITALDEAFVTSSDSLWGVRGMVEGEAEFYTTMVDGALNGIDVDALPLDSILEQKKDLLIERMLAAQSPYLASFYTVPYGLGSAYVGHAYAGAGAQGIRDQFVAPPLSARRLLLLDVAGEQEPQPVEFLDVPALTAESFEHVGTDSFGAIGSLIYQRTFYSPAVLEESLHLVADRIDVLDHDGTTALVWQFSFDDEAAAAALVERAAQIAPFDTWYDLEGGRVVLVRAGNGFTWQTLISALGL